jgi:hypothetical protein
MLVRLRKRCCQDRGRFIDEISAPGPSSCRLRDRAARVRPWRGRPFCGGSMGSVKDLTGRRFGKLTVLAHVDTPGRAMWRCKCDCGVETTVRGSHLRSRHSTACPECRHRHFVESGARGTKDMIGKRCGLLLVLRRAGSRQDLATVGSLATWTCRCSACGDISDYDGARLRRAGKKFCRCKFRCHDQATAA